MRDVTPERLEVHLTYRCPARCVFCSEAERMRTFERNPVTAAMILEVLKEWVPRGVRHVHFTGGEPTLHRQLPEILGRCKRLGLRTSLGTNGWRLADAAYAARILPVVDEFMISLHGPDAATHEGLSGRAGGFDRAVVAIARAPSPGVNIVATQRNLGQVVSTARLAVALGAGFVLVSTVSPEGDAVAGYTALAVPLSAFPALAEAVLEAVGKQVPVRFFGVPACALGKARACANDLHWQARVTVELANDGGEVRLVSIVSPRPDRGRAHPPACAGCTWTGVCPGPFVHYVEAFGEAGIQPLGASVRGAIPPHP